MLNPAEETEDEGSERVGMKRKRAQDEGAELRAEMAQLRNENEELRRQSELQIAQTNELMRQLHNLQTVVNGTLGGHQPRQAPQAPMLG